MVTEIIKKSHHNPTTTSNHNRNPTTTTTSLQRATITTTPPQQGLRNMIVLSFYCDRSNTPNVVKVVLLSIASTRRSHSFLCLLKFSNQIHLLYNKLLINFKFFSPFSIYYKALSSYLS